MLKRDCLADAASLFIALSLIFATQVYEGTDIASLLQRLRLGFLKPQNKHWALISLNKTLMRLQNAGL